MAQSNGEAYQRMYDPASVDAPHHPGARLSAPYAPARAVLEFWAQRAAGEAAPVGQPECAHVLALVDELTRRGGPVSSAESDTLRAAITAAVELLCPRDFVNRDDAEVIGWVLETFRLACSHLEGY